MTTPTTPPVDLQAIEARCEASYGFPWSSAREVTGDIEALLSLLREKDQVIERLERDVVRRDQVFTELEAVCRGYMAELATLKAGQEARELALIEYIIAWMNGDVEWPENNEAALAAFNEKYKNA